MTREQIIQQLSKHKKELRITSYNVCYTKLLRYESLTEKEKENIRQDYYNNIFPLVTPQSIDPAHPFPFISTLSLNLLVTLRYPQERELSLALV